MKPIAFSVAALLLTFLASANAQHPSGITATTSGRKPATSSSSPVISYNGGPVLGTALEGPVNVYLIFYGNWAGADPGGPAIMQDFVSNLGGSSYWNIMASYNLPSAIQNAVTLAGTYTDTGSQGSNLNDAGLLAVVENAIGGGYLPADSNAVYHVLTSSEVTESGENGTFCEQFCGFHTQANLDGLVIKYAFVGNPLQCAAGVRTCQGEAANYSQSPNDDPGVDAMISILAHETGEAVTDPEFNAWLFSGASGGIYDGYEEADVCSYTYGTTFPVSNGSVANVTLGDRSYLVQQQWVAASVQQCAMSATEAPQSITFAALSNEQIGTAPFTLTATASSGLTISFATTSPACNVSGNTVTLVAVGRCALQATQAGNADYWPATPVTESFQVTEIPQTISFAALPNKSLGAVPFNIMATASSGLTVSFASTTASICSVSGNTVTVVTTGLCSIQATQAGNATYAAATPVSQSFQVTGMPQTISFTALANQEIGSPPFAVGATASSGLTVGFASTTASTCSVSGETVTLLATGKCSIQAMQPGNATYAAAKPVTQSFEVTKLPQTITFAALPSKKLGGAPFLISATASSGLTVSFASTTTAICSVSGDTVTLVVAGKCSIKATQSGNATYAAAPPVTNSFKIRP